MVALFSVPTLHELGSAIVSWNVEPKPLRVVRAGAHGTFELGVPGEGLWTVVITRDGFVPVVIEGLPVVESQDLEAATLEPDHGCDLTITDGKGGRMTGVTLLSRVFWEGVVSPGRWRPLGGMSVSDSNRLTLPRGAKHRLSVTGYIVGHSPGRAECALHSKLVLEESVAAGQKECTLQLLDALGSPLSEALLLAGNGWPLALGNDRGEAELPSCSDKEIAALLPDGTLHRPRMPEKPIPRIRLTGGDGKRVTGRVLSSVEDTPVATALLHYEDPRPFPWAAPGRRRQVLATTDSRGTFEGKAPLGTPYLDVIAAGFESRRLTLVTSPGHQELVIRLVPTVELRGTIRDEEGVPLEFAEITVSWQDAAQAGIASHRQVVALSDSVGAFVVRGIKSDTPILLRVTKATFLPATRRGDSHVLAESPIAVVLGRGGQARGTLLQSDDGRPIAGARVLLLPQGRAQAAIPMDRIPSVAITGTPATSDHNGLFVIQGVAAGSFDLLAEAKGYSPRLFPSVVRVAGAESQELGELFLDAEMEVTGVVTNDDGHVLLNPAVTYARRTTSTSTLVPTVQGTRFMEAELRPDGSFVITGLEAGEVIDLRVQHLAYATRTVPGVRVPPPEPLSITLAPAGTLKGRVMDDQGEPIAGGYLTLESMDGKRWATVGTNRVGEFTFHDVPLGSSNLRAQASGFESLARTVEVSTHSDPVDVVLSQGGARLEGSVGWKGDPLPNTRIYIQGHLVTQADTAGAFDVELTPGTKQLRAVHPGMTHEVTKILNLKRGFNRVELAFDLFPVKGAVVDAEGSPVSGALVSLRDRGEARNYDAISLDSGDFSADLPSGRYSVSAYKRGVGLGRLPGGLNVGSSGLDDIEVVLVPPARIEGTVTGLLPQELAKARINAVAEDVPKVAQASLSKDESYFIEDLHPGPWQVSVEIPGEDRVLRRAVEVAAGATVRVDFSFGSGHTLQGLAYQDGAVFSAAPVFLLRGTDPTSLRRSITDYRGQFRFSELEAGDYLLVVDRHFQHLRITGNQTIEVRVSTGRVGGTVFDPETNLPIEGATVHLVVSQLSLAQADLVSLNYKTFTDATGSFSFESVPRNIYRVVVEKEGYEKADRVVSVGSQSIIPLAGR